MSPFHPVLTGTVPIAINVPSGNLDIGCEVHAPVAFINRTAAQFGDLSEFTVKQTLVQQLTTAIIRFSYDEWLFKLFGQPLPVVKQAAYRHMVTEGRILQLANAAFRKRIIELKQAGIKTEPAFPRFLQLPGDSYEALLSLASFSDARLHWLLTAQGYGL